MTLFDRLARRWRGHDAPLLIRDGAALGFADIQAAAGAIDDRIAPGDVVGLVGDFEPWAIARLIGLIDRGCVLVPLTRETASDHGYFHTAAGIDWVLDGDRVTRIRDRPMDHPLLDRVRRAGHAGLVLFSTGTTGRPKAILHDLTRFLRRFETPRPSLRTLSFLVFDHIGGINTLLHTLFNRGTVVSVATRSPKAVLEAIAAHDVEVLPATPTFLRMLLLSGLVPDRVPPRLTVITYGTERMDQPTLTALCAALPGVDFRQTFGMSELGILRVKSRARDSLFMKIGGEGVETRVDDGVLKIRSADRMLGYLNADSPFDAEGWYDTRDRVETDGDFIRVIGRDTDVINVGGLKFMASEVERAALDCPGVRFAKALGRANPITGQHVELEVELTDRDRLEPLTAFLRDRLPDHMRPRRIRPVSAVIGHRFKRV